MSKKEYLCATKKDAMQLKKLVGQTAVYGLSSIVARLINYLLTPYLTRILSPESYGIVGDMYALIPFCLVVLTMGLETGYLRFAGKSESKGEQDQIFSTSLIAISIATAIFLLLFAIFKAPIDKVLRYSNQSEITSLVAIIVALDVFNAIPFTRLRQKSRANRFVVVRVVSILVNVALTLFFFSWLPSLASKYEIFAKIYSPTFGVGYIFVANIISSITSTIMLSPEVIHASWSVSREKMQTIMLYSLPLLLSGILGTANEFIDRQMIKYLMPEDIAMSELGVYAAVVRISVIMVLFTQMYRFAAEPFFLSGFKKDEFKESNAAALKYYIIATLFIGLVVVLYLDLFALLVGENFREGVYIVPTLIVSNILAGVLFNLSFWYKYTEETNYALYITAIGFLATLILNYIMIPQWGYFGAAIARLGCESIMVVISYYFNQRRFKTAYDLKAIGFYAVLAAVIYGASITVEMENKLVDYTFNTILIAIFAIITLYRERKIIKAAKK